MEFVALAFAVFLVKQSVTLIKQLSARHYRDGATLVIAFAVGIGVAFLFCASNVAAAVHFGGIALKSLNGASKVILGFELGAAAATTRDVLKVVDDSQSAAEPKLLEGVTLTSRR